MLVGCYSFNHISISDDDPGAAGRFPILSALTGARPGKNPPTSSGPVHASLAPAAVAPIPQVTSATADFDAIAEGKRIASEGGEPTKMVCPVYTRPAIPDIPGLPFKKLTELPKGDMAGVDAVQEEHIMALRRNIFVTRKINDQSYANYLRDCREYNDRQVRKLEKPG